jgi:TonB family protein
MFLAKHAVIVVLLLFSAMATQARESKWRKAPRPKFPKDALKEFVKGSVTIRAVLTTDGNVSTARVAKSSGDARLDDAAVKAVLKWKMDPGAVTPSDLKEGRPIVFDFAQEAMLGAVYADRTAWFEGDSAKPWVFAPFAAYPREERRRRHEGTVWLKVKIGPDATVSHVEVEKSSGYPALDHAAVTAVRHWRAHKSYAGSQGRFPVTFQLGRR